jgi:hypothetical protein
VKGSALAGRLRRTAWNSRKSSAIRGHQGLARAGRHSREAIRGVTGAPAQGRAVVDRVQTCRGFHHSRRVEIGLLRNGSLWKKNITHPQSGQKSSTVKRLIFRKENAWQRSREYRWDARASEQIHELISENPSKQRKRRAFARCESRPRESVVIMIQWGWLLPFPVIGTLAGREGHVLLAAN